MTTEKTSPQPIINGDARTVGQLLANQRYGLEYYQREYSWERTQVEELVADLATAFEDQHEGDHTRSDVANYRPYFLGPIITNSRDGTNYIIDGQQRLTTLTLLLIHILHRLPDHHDLRPEVQRCIYSTKFGTKSFTLDVPARDACMEALLAGTSFAVAEATQSVRNLWVRYHDMEGLLDVEDALPLFVDWLLEKVILVEITTTESNMAYAIFETMNDRGLNLSPTDMLKSYLLSNVSGDDRVKASDDFWRERVKVLNDEEKNAAADFFKAWFRSSHAESMRQRKRGATPQDWDLIGTEFHKWVRDHTERLGLAASPDFEEFVNTDFKRMSRHYLRLLAAQRTLTPGLQHVRYNAETGFTLQLTVALAPVTPQDSDETADQKMELVARYLDGLVARRMVNFRNFGYSTMQYTMYNLCKEIRGLSLDHLRERLRQELEDLDVTFAEVEQYHLHKRNGKHIRYLLARLSDFVERGCGNEPVFEQLVDRTRKDPFEIEHIWANQWDRHQEEFETIHEFEDARNRFGALVLLPKSFNASYGALPYEQKLPHYRGQNLLLAKSLHPDTYDHNPSFRRFIDRTGVDFLPYPDGFSSTAIAERQALYRQLCELVWPSDAFDD